MSNCKVLLLEAGIVALDDSDKVISSYKFDTDAIRKYKAIKDGTAIDLVNSLCEELKSRGYSAAVSNDEGLAAILLKCGFNTSIMRNEEQAELQEQKVKIMINGNFVSNEFEGLGLLRKFALDLSSARVGEVSAKRDSHIIQSVNAMDEADSVINLMGSRLREWYGLHFPELDALIQNLLTYCDIVLAGSRDFIDNKSLKEMGIPDDKANMIVNAAQSSKGGAITLNNIEVVHKLAEEIKNLNQVRSALTSLIEHEMEEVAPNVKEILGATIGARMIARAGSLERLSSMAASTIQVIGAEKALFRAIKTGSRPPKHGIIFQHPLVHSAPRWQRGKIARAIASKVAIGARIDVHKATRDPTIMSSLAKRIEEIRERYKEPLEREREEFVPQKPQPWVRNREEKKKERRRFDKGRRSNKFGRRRR